MASFKVPNTPEEWEQFSRRYKAWEDTQEYIRELQRREKEEMYPKPKPSLWQRIKNFINYWK